MTFRKAAPWFVAIGVLLGVSVGTAKYKSVQTEQVETQTAVKVLPRSPVKQYANPIPKAPDGIVYRREQALKNGKNALLINTPASCGLQGVEFIKVDLHSRTQDGKYSVENGKCEIYEFNFDWLTNEIEEEALNVVAEQ
jgi:hypothetical protein